MLYLIRHGLAAAGVEDLDPGLRVIPVRIANCSITRMKWAVARPHLIEAASFSHLPAGLVSGVEQALPGTPAER